MWTRFSLTLKITGPLIIMEIMGLVVGGLLLISKIEKARLKEIDSLLMGQADLIEESFKFNKGQVDLQSRNDLFIDLNRDAKLFLQILYDDGTVFYASSGPSPELQDQLAKFFRSKLGDTIATNHVFDLSFGGEHWRAIREDVEYRDDAGKLGRWRIFTAVDQTASMSELNFIRKLIFFGAIFLAIITSLATAAIVLVTTSNLRLFAQSLGRTNPDYPVWNFHIAAQSAEERLLFTSFAKMIGEMETARQNQKLFIANASHELKTPVAGMMAALEVVLSRERSVADYQAVCRDILKTVKDLRRLTGVLLDTSLIEGGKLQPFGPVDLKGVIEKVLERWQPSGDARKIVLKWDSPIEGFLILGNEELVDVAISNLLDNAIKYSEVGMQVELRLSRLSDGKIKFLIKDEGVGMTAQELEKLGDIFFRADISRSTKDSFGLGFANAKKIIQSHGARLTVVSEPKVGTEVTTPWDPLPKNFRLS